MGPFGVVCSGRGFFVLDVIASIAGTRAKIEKDLEDMSQSSESLVESIESNRIIESIESIRGPSTFLRAILRRFFLGLNAINFKSAPLYNSPSGPSDREVTFLRRQDLASSAKQSSHFSAFLPLYRAITRKFVLQRKQNNSSPALQQANSPQPTQSINKPTYISCVLPAADDEASPSLRRASLRFSFSNLHL